MAVNVVRAVVQSYLDFMDRMHKGTAGEISRMLTKEREELAEKLSRKQQELLECRRHFADMGFRSDGKTLHPTVQRAVYFNDALIAAQKQRVEHEALLATIQTAVLNGEDLGQYMMSVGDAVGREMLLNSLGLGSRDANTQASLEQNLIADRAELQTAQQNLGPMHPEVVALGREGPADRAVPRLRAGAHQPARGGTPQEPVGAVAGADGAAEARRIAEEGGDPQDPLRGDPRRSHQSQRPTGPDRNARTRRQTPQRHERRAVEPDRLARPEAERAGSARGGDRGADGGHQRRSRRSCSCVVLLAILGGFGVALGLVTLLDALDDRFRSVDEMQSRLGLPLLTMIQQLEAPESVGPAGVGRARHAHLGGERELPHAADRADADAPRRPPDRRHQRRAGRRQDDHPGQPGRLLCPGRQANAVDRRRPAASRADGPDGHARAARPERGPPLGSRHCADGAAAHPALRHQGAGHPAFRLRGPAIRRNCSAARGSRNCWPGRKRSTT